MIWRCNGSRKNCGLIVCDQLLGEIAISDGRPMTLRSSSLVDARPVSVRGSSLVVTAAPLARGRELLFDELLNRLDAVAACMPEQ